MTKLGAAGLLGGPSPDDSQQGQVQTINPNATQRVISGRQPAKVALVGQAAQGGRVAVPGTRPTRDNQR